ncbi:MAG TPA: NADH-quinone oxidoreductase subunit N [Bryobacteraceae bacterium]|nr:NADH-quinone oxidoreductase subunit N [Bryobacteraceae bacterium]HPT25445.1 NADH-quinone oxidoreductase subunit N [Bryobacteraceae bacterium]
MSSYYTATDHFVLLPALLLGLFACATLLFDFWVFPESKRRKHLAWFVLMGEVFASVAYLRQQMFLNQHGGELQAFGGSLVVDQFALYFHWIFVIATAIVVVMSYRYFEVRDEHHGEYYGLLLLAQTGMYFLASGNELVVLYVGLETMALTFYVLVGTLKRDQRSNEAAMKYFLLGGLSSGLLVYGFSLLYGMSGSTKLREIGVAVANRSSADTVLFLAIATIISGLLFKVAAAPFHIWAPDTYEGAPTVVTAYLAVASKAASLALMLRVLLGPLGTAREVWEPIIAGAALLSMTVGNIAAVTQTNTKRLLAYSSINHAGYILLGIVAGNQTGIQGVLIYILIYVFMTLGAFLVLTVLCRETTTGEDINDLHGLMKKSPAHAIWMLIFLLSLAGIPPTAGYVGKLYIFLSLVETGHYFLAVAAAIYVAVAIYYYFRIVKSMFIEEEETAMPALSLSLGTRVALLATGVMTLGIGVYPEPFVKFAQQTLMR